MKERKLSGKYAEHGIRTKKPSLPLRCAEPSGNTAAFYNTSTNFINHSQSTRADPKFYTKADFYKSSSAVRSAKTNCPSERISIDSEELMQYEDDIKGTIDKMLHINGYSKLELNKQLNGRYTVSLEDLALLLATMISDLVRKNEEINQLEKKVKALIKTESQHRDQLKELQTQHQKTFKEITEHSSLNTIPTLCKCKSQVNVLEEIQKILKVKDVYKLPQSVKQMTQLCRVVPQMELFIREISNVVQAHSPFFNDLGTVLPTLKKWASELEEREKFRQEVCQILYGKEIDIKDKQLVSINITNS
jgi:hypothetical protein